MSKAEQAAKDKAKKVEMIEFFKIKVKNRFKAAFGRKMKKGENAMFESFVNEIYNEEVNK